MPLLTNRRLILAKTEVTYGTDPTPTGAANAILVSNLEITPQDADYVNRDLVRPFIGRSEQLPASIRARVSFEVEIAASGTAGTAPAWGPLVKACAFSETTVASTSVTYNPVSSTFDSVTIYFQVDGVQHKLTGARGSVSVSLKAKDRPTMKFEFLGIYNAVADVALATPTFTAFKTPLAVNNTNTTGFTLHSLAGVLSELNIDMAVQTVHRDLVGGAQAVLITDREPTGSVMIEAGTVASKDWWTLARNATLGALAITHGTVAGQKVAFNSSNVQVTNPRYQDQDGVQMLQMDLQFIPSTAGNDEIAIVCT
jgi:Phage tail tube protein